MCHGQLVYKVVIWAVLGINLWKVKVALTMEHTTKIWTEYIENKLISKIMWKCYDKGTPSKWPCSQSHKSDDQILRPPRY